MPIDFGATRKRQAYSAGYKAERSHKEGTGTAGISKTGHEKGVAKAYKAGAMAGAGARKYIKRQPKGSPRGGQFKGK